MCLCCAKISCQLFKFKFPVDHVLLYYFYIFFSYFVVAVTALFLSAKNITRSLSIVFNMIFSVSNRDFNRLFALKCVQSTHNKKISYEIGKKKINEIKTTTTTKTFDIIETTQIIHIHLQF